MFSTVNETVGKLAGDTRMQMDGKAEQVAGRVQNVARGVEDTPKG